MAGAGQPLDIEIDDAELRRELTRLLAAVGDLRPALREIGEVLVRSTKQRFHDERDPDGQRWEPNADATLRAYLRRRQGRALRGKKILTGRGTLADSIAYRLEGQTAVAVGTPRDYGAMHQFGGTRADHPHLWGNIPARPYLGISDEDRADISAILRAHLAG